MSRSDLAEAVAQLEHLSDARAKHVLSLIADLTELEALENATDLKAAREALGESSANVPWEQAKSKLDAQFGFSQPAS